MASPSPQREKLRILLIPYFATSHTRPFTDLAFHLAAARPGVVEVTVAVTPANVPVVRSALARRHGHAAVQVATYAFPPVDGLSPGVENHSTARAADAWRIEAAAVDERLMRPGQESLIRDRSPDAIVSDLHFIWNADIAAGLGVPCISFHVIGAFPMLAIFNLLGARATEAAAGVVALPGLPGPEIRVPVTELPEIVRNQRQDDGLAFHLAAARPGVVEVTVAVTPANVPVVRSALARRHGHAAVQVATYAFPPVDGLPPGVENHSAARAADAWRIDAAAGAREPHQGPLARRGRLRRAFLLERRRRCRSRRAVHHVPRHRGVRDAGHLQFARCSRGGGRHRRRGGSSRASGPGHTGPGYRAA